MSRFVIAALVGLVTSVGGARHAEGAVGVQLVASGVPYLVGIQHAGDDSGRLFLVSQSGKVLIINATHMTELRNAVLVVE